MSSIILASESFLKNFIFEKSKIPYTKVPAEIDESVFDNFPVDERVAKLAEKKCQTVSAQFPDAIIISADTLTADASGAVYNKLSSGSDPFQAAMNLSGKTIDIFTGCTVYHVTTGYVSQLFKSTVTYSNFTEENLKRLIEDDNASIRSGALGIFFDAPGFTLIEHIEGSYTGSFGLPMEFVYQQLEKINQKDTE